MRLDGNHQISSWKGLGAPEINRAIYISILDTQILWLTPNRQLINMIFKNKTELPALKSQVWLDTMW